MILDGLDVVPSQKDRRRVYEKIEEFLSDAEDLGADVSVVVTTRPTGYDERFPPEPTPSSRGASTAGLSARPFA